jgi:hypothetical protein
VTLSRKFAVKGFANIATVFTLLITAVAFAPSALAADVTLTYNSNTTQHQTGVISAGALPTSSVHAQNSSVTVSANSGNLSRQGFTFGGWNTLATGLGTNYTAGSGTFTIAANTTLYANWLIPPSARLIGSTGTISVLKNNTFNRPNYTGICSSGISGITSDGTFIYFRSSISTSTICKVDLDGTFVSSNTVTSAGGAPLMSSIDVNNRDLTFSSGCIWLRESGDVANSALYCISVSDWTMRPVATPTGKGLYAGTYWLYGNLIDFPDGRVGAVSTASSSLGQTGTSFGGANGNTTISCPSNMYCKVLRLYKPSGTGASVSLAFSEDIVLADSQTGWPNDDHGIATDGTYLYQINYASGYKVWALARGAPSYLVFNGAGSGSCGAGTAISATGTSNTLCPINTPLAGSSGAMGNSTFFGHNHVTNQYFMGDYQSNQFYVSAGVTPPAGPGSATGLSNLTISAGTLVPSFNSSVSTYADTITASTSSITVTPTALDAGGATIMVKANSGSYASVITGTASASLTMNTGMNTVLIQATGTDGSTAVTTINVFRPENPTITLTPAFTNTTRTYLDTLTVSIGTSVYTPTGTFLFTENGTAISGCSTVAISTGTARCNWTPTTTGSRTIVATYSGDNNVGLRSDTRTVTVNDLVAITSSTAAISQKYGSSGTTRTVAVSGGTDTRTVTATSTSLASGRITFDTATALFTIDTRTTVGTYTNTITVTDVRGSSASYTQTINITVADTLTVTSDTSTVTFTGTAANVNPVMTAVSGLVTGDVISGATFNYSNSGGAAYGPTTTKPTNAATYTITPSALTFSNGATSNYAAITYRTSTLTINKAPQTTLITTPLYNVFNGNPTSATLYTTGGSDTGTVSFAFDAVGSTAGGCALSGLNNSVVTVTSAGTCRIVATKAGTSNYLIAISDTATVTFYQYVSYIPLPRAAEFPTEIVLSGSTAWTNNGLAPTITFTGTDISAQSPGGIFTISGSGFVGTRLVRVSGTNAAFTVLSDTSLQITMPSGLIGISGPIYVEKAEGSRVSEDWVTGTVTVNI